MDVSIILYDGCSAWGSFGCQEILKFANGSYRHFNRTAKDFFNISLVSANKKRVKTAHGAEIKTDKTIDKVSKTDLILITGTTANLAKIVEENNSLIEWLKLQHSNGTQIATYCTGSFLLAATGILKGKNAVTHWFKENEFCQMFDDINLQSDNIILDEGNLLMAGGGSSYHNLMIYLIEKYMEKRVAVFVSKLILVDMYKDVQTSYSIFMAQKQHNDEPILKAQELIENNVTEKLSLEDLYEHSMLSERSFLRRFKNATGNTPVQYIQRVKVEAAKKMLEHSILTFEEIVRKVGYEDISSFRKVFKKITGVAPLEYRKKYQFQN